MRRASQKTSPKSATALFAYAAGATAILANAFLIAFYALLPTNLQLDDILGSASDLVGSLATAFIIPVALYLVHDQTTFRGTERCS
jgi:hypothetical protein